MTSCEDDRSWNILVWSHHQFGLDIKPCIPQQAGNLVRPATVAAEIDRATRVALTGMARLVTDMKANE